jgi:hypothetical protein
MALQSARVRGEQTERLLDALALLGRLKLLGVEAPGEQLGEGLEDRQHRGWQITLGGRVCGAYAPLDAHGEQEQAEDGYPIST